MNISLTSFVDFLGAAGEKKLTVVKKIKCRGPYSPMSDHWKQFRDAVVEFHGQSELNKKDFFDQFLALVNNPKKSPSFKIAADNYKKFLAKKDIECYPTRKAKWEHNGVTIAINPELCLSINSERALIKLA